jgi:hypothetical protein
MGVDLIQINVESSGQIRFALYVQHMPAIIAVDEKIYEVYIDSSLKFNHIAKIERIFDEYRIKKIEFVPIEDSPWCNGKVKAPLRTFHI